MSAKAKLDKAATRIAKADAAVTDEFSERQPSQPMQLLAKLSDAAGLVAARPRLIRAGARMLLAHELATVVKNFVKRRVDRTRPRSADTHRQAKVRAGRNTGKEITSFPSGHTAGAIAVAMAFAREFPEYRIPALAAAGFVGIAQIPRCAHYPTDVGAGALLGATTEAALAKLWPAEGGDEERGMA